MAIKIEEQYDKIYRYCYFKLHDRRTAEDITQETFLRYLQKYDHMTADQTLKYLYTIAGNLCIDEYRRHAAKPQDAMREDTVSEAVLGKDFEEDRILTALIVRAVLSELTQEEQELLLLRYVNEVPVAAIGRMFGISRFAVHRRLAAAQKKFRGILEKTGGY